MSGTHPLRLSRVFADMARSLIAEESVQEVLDRLVVEAVRVVAGCDDAGVLLVDGRRRVYAAPAATSELVRTSDRLQFEYDEGPCLDAARHERSFLVTDMSAENRWPRYAPRAAELGVASVLGFELYAHEGTFGALDLYSRRPYAFDEYARELGWVFASHAAVAIAGARRDANLRAAFQTRQEIGEAVGVLMERYKVPSERAFEMLRRGSMDRNMKLREVARRVTETGELVTRPGSTG